MKYKKGKIVKGTITGIENYGAFLRFEDFYTGLLHISEISHGYVKDIRNFFQIGDDIYVEVLDVNEEEHKLSISIKNIEYKPIKNFKKRKIIETSQKFNTLAEKLPKWVSEELKSVKK